MQQPADEDPKDLSPTENLHRIKTTTHSCPYNTVPGPNQKCLKKCAVEEFDQSDRTLYGVSQTC